MAVLKVQMFGGVMPSTQNRRLPDDAAQAAHNLDMAYGDFRPLAGPGESVATVAVGTKSIFRTPSGVWLSSTNDVNYVNGQINDAASERVYLTGRSSYPEAWQGGTYRRLGVPRPTTAPTTVTAEQDQFSREDLNQFRQEFIAAVIASLGETDALVGDAPPAFVAPGVFDAALYRDTLLHLQMNDAGDGFFTDSSRFNRTISAREGVSFGSTGDGPYADSEDYAVFSGGSYQGLTFGNVVVPATTPWQVDFVVRPSTTWNQISAASRSGELSVLALGDVDGGYGSNDIIFSKNGRSTSDSRRFSYTESNLIPSGAWTQIRLVNTTSQVLVFVGGVLKLTHNGALALSVGQIGATDVNANGRSLDGDVDEFRVMSGESVSFSAYSPPTSAWPSYQSVGGVWIAHGTSGVTPSLPTTESGDAAFCVLMQATGSGYQITDQRMEYLRDARFGGQEITYLSQRYWSVPFKLQAIGKSVNGSAILAALEAIQDPTDPPTLLLAPAQAQAIADEVTRLYDTSQSPALSYVDRINSAQASLLNRLAADQSGGSTALTSSQLAAAAASVDLFGDNLRSACASAKEYFDGLNADAAVVLGERFDAIVIDLLPDAVERTVGDRVYVYTYVTDWGEESAPSPASALIQVDQNDTVDITVAAPPSGRNVVGWRLYRSSTTNTGAAFQLVADAGAGNAVLDGPDFNYYDIATPTLSDDQLQGELLETLQTLTWDEPPAEMIGLVGLPNGMMAGFYGKTLCLCEPFEPYAWPAEYRQPLEFDIVGLGVFGQTLVVLTTGNPYYASGADSASMSAQKRESTQACSAKRTIVSMEGGVVFASPDGLCLASPNGVQVLTEGAFDRDDWQDLDLPQCYGGFHEGTYYLFTPEDA